MHAHVMGETEALGQYNVNFPQGLVTWKGWLAPEGSIACVEGQFGFILPVLLP